MRVAARVLVVTCGIGLLGTGGAGAQSSEGPPARVGDYPITAVPLTSVHVTDQFWRPKLETNRTVSIPHIIEQNELTGRIDNFLKAAHKKDGAYQGQRYNDTDVYKVVEAASYSLAAHPDSALDRKIDDIIAIVGAAQEPDGYLYTPRTVDPKNPPPGIGPERWSQENTSHELYVAGHMYEAAVAHFQATGKRTFLTIAIKNADLVCTVFGPAGIHEAPGHEEIELALVKLYRATGDRKYLDESQFFLEERGTPHSVEHPPFPQGDRFFMYNDLAYRQDKTPVIDETRAVGHAVRATYLFSGLTDIAEMLSNSAFGRAVDRLWDDVTSKRIYITGGLGAVGSTEAFGDDYVLPNRTAYTETCASIGGMLWYHRLFLRDGDAVHLDVFERTLYNGYLSGVSIAGDTFFYQNPLESTGTGRNGQRSSYFDVACCPANLARLMAQLPGLIYAQRAQRGAGASAGASSSPEVFVNLFVGSDATMTVGARTVRIAQNTDYPWQGDVTIHVDPDQPVDFALSVRVPGWTRGLAMPTDLYRYDAADHGPQPTLTVNGKSTALAVAKGFATIRRRWQKGDIVRLALPMPIRRTVANDRVAEDRGKFVIERGPLVYCLEGVDNGGKVLDVAVPAEAMLSHQFKADLLGGIEVITLTSNGSTASPARVLTAIPYYAWANRGRGEMAVWIPEK
jgi:DUF1680 family protein